MVAIIGGGFQHFRLLVELYREAGREAGHTFVTLKVGVHAVEFAAGSGRHRRRSKPAGRSCSGRSGPNEAPSTGLQERFEAMCGPYVKVAPRRSSRSRLRLRSQSA